MHCSETSTFWRHRITFSWNNKEQFAQCLETPTSNSVGPAACSYLYRPVWRCISTCCPNKFNSPKLDLRLSLCLQAADSRTPKSAACLRLVCWPALDLSRRRKTKSSSQHNNVMPSLLPGSFCVSLTNMNVPLYQNYHITSKTVSHFGRFGCVCTYADEIIWTWQIFLKVKAKVPETLVWVAVFGANSFNPIYLPQCMASVPHCAH